MKFNEIINKDYSSGTLIKKHSCNGRVIRVENLDVETADRINKRVYVSVKQNEVEKSNGLKIASKLYTH
ncbi:MAG: hypothetical protein Q4D76_20110 [Oscillospiraceae bacterium]|nr:hypothetical protein [Oscillospiraceae bacterium]